jgi:nucleoside-diphosphate-sugar epimerase
MPTIFITGSQGLIGKTLTEYLKKNSYQVNLLDINLPVSHPHYGDINQPELIHQQLENCTGIIHLAAVSRVIWGEQQPELCWQTNVVGTSYLLEAAYKAASRPWFIYASSREVYGQQKQLPVTESALLQPLNTYARSKVAAEELVNQYQALGLKTSILRFSSVYGRIDDHANRVVPAFCRAAAFGEPLRVEGLDNTFDFTHVSDVVDGIIKTIMQLQQGQSLPAIHLTTGQPTTLGELAKLACNISKKPAKLIEAPPRNFDVSKFYGNPCLAEEKLGWQPKIDIETGVAQLVNAFLKADNLNTSIKARAGSIKEIQCAS